MKPKTLKDMKSPQMKWEFVDRNKLCSRKELKQEAVKWIKELINEQKLFSKGDYTKIKGYDWETYRGEDIIAWIKHFFDISDEEVDESPQLK